MGFGGTSPVPSPAGFAGVLSPYRERRVRAPCGARLGGGIPAFAGMTVDLCKRSL